MSQNHVRSSLAFSFLEKYIAFVIQLISSMIVARLITPEQFGIFAIAFSIVSFTQAIRDMGTNSYIIQKTCLIAPDVRACLFVGFIVAASISVILLFTSGLIGKLYGPDVLSAVFILIFNLFLMPISSTIFAVLQREMRFDLLLRINIAGAIANSGCAIALAAAGWGAVSLAWACVAGQLASALGAALSRPHREHFFPSYVGAKEVFRFGSVVMLGTLLSQISTNIANLITARFVTLEALGLYNRAQSVSSLFSRLIMDAINPIMLPLFSNLQRENSGMSQKVLDILSLLAVITWPFTCLLSICSEPFIVVMFGDQWRDAAILLRLIAIGGLFWIIPSVANPVLVAMGRAKDVLHIQLINQIIAIVGVTVAAMQGIEIVAFAVIPISALHSYVWLYYTQTVIGVHIGQVVRSLCKSAVITIVTLAAVGCVMIVGDGATPLEKLVFAVSAAGLSWFVAVFILRHPIASEVSRLALYAKRTAIRRVGA